MNRTLIPAVLGAALLAVSPMPAHAQLGGLIKKAAGKIVDDKVKEKENELKPVKPLEGDPVTATSFDQVLKGLQFEIGQQAEAVRLKKIQEAKQEAWSRAYEAGHDDDSKYRAANEKVISCISSALNDLERKHQEELQARAMNLMNDPKMQEMVRSISEYGLRMGEAQQKGDTAAVRRIQQQMMKATGVDLPADSAKARATCGNPPAPPASVVRLEKTADELRDANEALRKVESDLSGRAAQVAGMPSKEYFLARERLWAWNNAKKNKVKAGVTTDEDALFSSRAADIQKVAAALR